jgi:hypothetical protein
VKNKKGVLKVNRLQKPYRKNMKIKNDLIKHFKSCKPTKYDAEKHLGIMIDVFSEGEGVMAFCDEALISKDTFYEWLKTHKEFKTAYEVIINRAGRQWETYPKTAPDFNFPYWSMIMRNRFGYGKPKVRIVKDATPLERMDAIWDGIEKGELSTQEATQLGSLVTVQNNILNGQPLESEQFKRDTREELMDKISAIQKVIDYSEGK